MTDISENCIVNPPVTVFCFISNIVLEKKIEVSLAALYVAFLDRGQMRKCFMDGYDGSKTSHHGNEVMVLKSPHNSVKRCFGAQNSVFLIGSGHKCPVPVAEYFLDSRVSLFYHDILEETVTTWFGLSMACKALGDGQGERGGACGRFFLPKPGCSEAESAALSWLCPLRGLE